MKCQKSKKHFGTSKNGQKVFKKITKFLNFLSYEPPTIIPSRNARIQNCASAPRTPQQNASGPVSVATRDEAIEQINTHLRGLNRDMNTLKTTVNTILCVVLEDLYSKYKTGQKSNLSISQQSVKETIKILPEVKEPENAEKQENVENHSEMGKRNK